MNTQKRKSHRFLFALVGLLALNLWMLWEWQSSKTLADEAKRRLEKVEQLAEQIMKLREAPVRTELATRSNDSLAELIDQVAQSSGLGNEGVLNIESGSIHYLGDTPYQEQTTQIDLRDARLDQITKFALNVTKTDPGILIPKITVRAPYGAAGESADELWKSQMTLTSRIYAPKSGTPK